MVCSPLGEGRERIWRVKFGNLDTVVTQLVRKERGKQEEEEKMKKGRSEERGRKKGRKTQFLINDFLPPNSFVFFFKQRYTTFTLKEHKGI